ncbi:MAG: hypothetical protein A2X05_06765 [Bacteroidetes bacterium GWE2_41_25]|nr:MAG: hypothetical protein A2X03_06070 [Bacteroidetes bacterium GWA2_40_15]OFX90887.1 MAG: hypothetical protein A2X05_06765 [Bacteroidetes bacterium GWE2_41_25]OFX94474.1 MAG: hypothetical protein A2X06_00050 [Bacteroidetes bacterium GWC2_40_22]OFY60524.1 MAG: hypothetical protein A2X04_00935 [Bacteroidetes bacterium GWF2_41_9]HBH82436.1 hypothetical protein [Bacteroidales bacterium]
MKKHAGRIHKWIKYRMKKLVIILFFLGYSLMAVAQMNNSETWSDKDCSERLSNANTSYQGGSFIDCIEILERALISCKFSRKEKEQALELLAKCYIETGEKEKAESTVNLLLTNYPHYELREAENPELFNRMVKKYKIHPLFTIGAKNVANWLRHETVKVYSVLEGIDYSKPLNESGYWFTYYGVAEYEFTDGISVSGDLMVFWSTYTRNFTEDPSFELTYNENDYFLELPFYLKKYFYLNKNILAYASGGVGVLFLYKARGNVSINYTKNDIATTGIDADFEGNMDDFNALPIKNTTVGQWNTGVGIGYKLKNLRFFIDARYIGSFSSFTSPENSDNIPVLRDDYFYIDQKMKINQFEIGATISYTLINSVKRIRK